MRLTEIKTELDKKGFSTRITDNTLIAGIQPEVDPVDKIRTLQSAFDIEILNNEAHINYFSGQLAKTGVFSSMPALMDFITKNHPFS